VSGSVNGVNLTTTGANIALVNAGTITSAAGRGINTDSGTGSTVIVDDGNVSGSTIGIAANTSGTGPLDIALGGAVTVTGTSLYGILASSMLGVVNINTSPDDTINSGSTGINALNQGSSVPQANNSAISISTYGTINSGSNPNSGGGEPGGISAGYRGTTGTSAPTTAVFGNVNVSNNANITAAAGYGIDAYNYGVGNITVSDGPGTTITATAAGTTAAGFAQYGIAAFGYEAGNTSVTVANGATINSGSVGIDAVNQATAIPLAELSSVTLVDLGSISSGANNSNSGFAPAGIQTGFNPNSASAFNPNVNGNVFVDLGGSIIAAAGDGIKAVNFGIGDVTIDLEYGASITATHSATGVSDKAPYGIGAFNFGPGDIAVTMSSGDVITSGSSGIEAINEATAITSAAGVLVAVSAAGTISSGTILTDPGTQPSGISAGFLGGTSAASNLNVNGTVIVNNAANITAAAGKGIYAFNYGNGDVTVNDASGTTVSGAEYGIEADTESGGGIGNIAINVYSGATVNATSGDGIFARSTDVGNISVITSSGDTINSGSAGIGAVNEAATISTSSSIVVTAHGSIDSGTALTGSGDTPAGITAGYNPNHTDTPDNNVHGDVSINDFASILAPAGTDGIGGINYGTGAVTIIAEAGATIAAGRYGIGALGFDGGDVSVTNYAIVTGSTAAIDAMTTSTGTSTIDNYGHLNGNVTSYNSTFTNEVAADWSLNGISAFTGTSNLVNYGAIQSNGISEISGLSGITNSGTIEVQSGSLKLDADVSGSGALTIDTGSTLELASGVSSGQTVTFSSTTGTLKLDSAQSFHGTVSGLNTLDGTEANSDQIDLANINRLSTSFSETFNALTDVLNVTDGTNTANIQFAGTVGNLNFVPDGNNGTVVYDPPVTTSQSIGPVVMNDPGPPAASTIAATAPNQTLTGFATSDTFAFNFASFGQATVTDFHPATDTLQFSSKLFANLQAALNATHDDGHGNTVIALDAHDAITLNGIIKAQLQASDFHFV
jgi:hypothetical protein